MAGESLKILLVEDNPGDARLLSELLRKAFVERPSVEHVERLREALDAFKTQIFEVILLDLTLPDSTGLSTLNEVVSNCGSVPVVVLTGNDNEAVGMEAIHAGAQDYFVKGQIDGRLLARAIRYAQERKKTQVELQQAHDLLEQRVRQRTAELEDAVTVLGEEVSDRRHAEEALRESQKQFKQMIDAMPEVFWMVSADMKVLHFVNQAYRTVWGRSPESLCQDPRSWIEGVHPEDRPKVQQAIEDWVGRQGWKQERFIRLCYRVVRPDGSILKIRSRAFAICDEKGNAERFCGIAESVEEEQAIAAVHEVPRRTLLQRLGFAAHS